MTTTAHRTGTRPTEAQSTWQIDPVHSEIGFSVKHLMIATVRGRFGGVRGAILLDDSDLANSSVEVEIDVATIDTRQPQRDNHLRSADFFEVAKFPTIAFRSRRVEQGRGKHFRVVGDLTMHGVTRELGLEVTDGGRRRDPSSGQDRAGFSATTSLDRRDFGLTWNQALEGGGVLVGPEIRITIDLEAVKTKV